MGGAALVKECFGCFTTVCGSEISVSVSASVEEVVGRVRHQGLIPLRTGSGGLEPSGGVYALDVGGVGHPVAARRSLLSSDHLEQKPRNGGWIRGIGSPRNRVAPDRARVTGVLPGRPGRVRLIRVAT